MKASHTIKLFDNVIVSVFFLFLPFTYALTFDLGFPLKISEIALVILVAFLLLKLRITGTLFNKAIFQALALFVFISLLSTIVNLFWTYPYPLLQFESRFGYKFDSILKGFYVLLACSAFIFSARAFYANEQKFINYFLLGAILASFYSWYLFLSGLLGLPEFLLPGIEEPQRIAVSIGTFIRSGTFKEGNYMGLFLLYAVVLSFYSNQGKLAYFFIATLMTTFSSIAFVSMLVFLVLYFFKRYYNKRHFSKLLVVFLALLGGGILAMGNKDFQVLVASKFQSPEKGISNVGEFSKVDRLNTASVAYEIGLENPVLGVGLSNYSLHYGYFNDDVRFRKFTSKRIPNNVYAEMFSEIGIVGLLAFLYFLFLLYRQTKHDQTRVLRYGLLASLIYFIAFPTFTILYIWVFFGLIASLDTRR